MTQEDKDFQRFIETGMLTNWKQYHEIEPIVFITSKDNKLGMMPISPLMASPQTKSLITPAIKRISKEIMAVRAAMVSEVWVAISKGDNKKIEEEFKQAGSVKDMPSKQEAIMLNIWTKQETILKTWIVDRANNTLTPFGEPIVIPITQEVHSIFQNPFKPDLNVN